MRRLLETIFETVDDFSSFQNGDTVAMLGQSLGSGDTFGSPWAEGPSKLVSLTGVDIPAAATPKSPYFCKPSSLCCVVRCCALCGNA